MYRSFKIIGMPCIFFIFIIIIKIFKYYLLILLIEVNDSAFNILHGYTDPEQLDHYFKRTKLNWLEESLMTILDVKIK